MPPKPNLGLAVEITTASGTRFQWGKGSNVPGDVPQNLNFSTRLGDGFADASITLARRIDQDYADINLFDNVVFYGQDGSVAYEGRVGANPRSVGDTHSMSVVCAGWMAHTRDRKFTEVYVDRDPGRWVEPMLLEKARLGGLGLDIGSFSWSSEGSGLICALPNQALGAQAFAAIFYNAGPGLTIGKVSYNGTDTSLPAGWLAPDLRSTTDGLGGGEFSTSATFDSTLRTLTPASATRYAYWRHYANGTASTPAAGSNRRLSVIAVYGSSGITTRSNGTEPDGVYASDVIVNVISRFCPQLNTSGVQATTYPIGHLTFLDRTDPYDAIAEVNRYHRWQFGVYENRTLNYFPVDLTDYDWAVDLYEPGVTLDVQGDSTDDGAFNGICVTFTDLATGNESTLTPDTNPELADTDPENPANRQGIKHWDEIQLSAPALSADAVAIAQAALVEKNTPKGQGTITVRGHIKDRAGHWQQGWKVRAGDRVAITSSVSLSDRPRLISETSWDNDSKTLTITVEDTAQRVDAFLDRLNTALTAAGLS